MRKHWLSLCGSRWTFACWLLALTFALGGHNQLRASGKQSTPQQPTVQFEKDILPILRQHCFDCHSEENVEGDLRLDSSEGFQNGGHSGSPILADTIGNSELYLRITSTTDGYRMPKRRPRLPEEQIQLITDWIKTGANLPSSFRSVPPNRQSNDPAPESIKKSKSLIEWLGEVWNSGSEAFQFYRWQYLAWAVVIVSILFGGYWLYNNYETAAERAKRNQETDEGNIKRSSLGWSPWIVAGLIAYCSYLNGYLIDLASQNDSAVVSSETKSPAKANELIVNLENLPQPPYPMHPSRLGGTYYRGNDERSDQLFNGGFYRTATIELGLVDDQGTPIRRGDTLPSNVFIDLTILRAPHATTELFGDRVHDATYLKHYSMSPSLSELGVYKFEIVEPLDRWRVRIPLDLKTDQQSETWNQSGAVYLFYGQQQYESQTGRVHFGIMYDLAGQDRRLGDKSELWMGSLYNLNGRVLVPDENQVLLDRWFDFRPIPVIQGESSQDPELLGLPEHQSTKAKLNEG